MTCGHSWWHLRSSLVTSLVKWEKFEVQASGWNAAHSADTTLPICCVVTVFGGARLGSAGEVQPVSEQPGGTFRNSAGEVRPVPSYLSSVGC